jgi:DNA-directed RNA polymerase subunit RPC12/RpoP
MENTKTTIVDTSSGLKNGLNRCPSCGSTNVELDIKSGQLQCQMCRTLFDPVRMEQDDIKSLKGESMGGGAVNIIPDTKDILTFKCSSCGAEVVVDTAESTLARCHWCRHSFGINEQIPNGAVPDMVLPFKIEKSDAQNKINDFLKKRQFFANKVFKKEFTLQNIMGVYLPYMIVDLNGHGKLVGQGEHLVRRYTVGSGDHKKTYYDADLYDVSREFDLFIDDLSIESSTDKLNQNTSINTNNVINSIMPFDTENCLKWNANFLKGYASERRDTNTDALKPVMLDQAKDIARFKANESLEFYDRGVAWSNEDLTVKGISWKSAYLPVWIYSYFQKDLKLLHYFAVNARTGETMGSVPINKFRLWVCSILVEIFGGWLGLEWLTRVDDDSAAFGLLGFTTGFIFYYIFWKKYRNPDKRHLHEKETKTTLENLQKYDQFVEHRTGLSNSMMDGANNTNVQGRLNKYNIFDAKKLIDRIR